MSGAVLAVSLQAHSERSISLGEARRIFTDLIARKKLISSQP